MEMKRTPLYREHLALGARMVEFVGWEMPIQYSGIIEEHIQVRRQGGVFDVSHMGDLLIRGRGAAERLDGLLTNPISKAQVGKAVYGHLLSEEGQIIDDVITYHLSEGQYLMVPNASNVSRVRDWVRERTGGLEVVDLSTRLACLAVQGPAARDVLQALTPLDLSTLKRFQGSFTFLSGPPSPFLSDLLPSEGEGVGCYIARTGYTGEDGFEVLVEDRDAPWLWKALLKDQRLRPVGLGARDTLRLEMGYLLSGTDFDGSQTSLQTGPPWVVKMDHQFVGREALVLQGERKYDVLVGMELTGKGVPRHGYEVLYRGRKVGKVTSGNMSPCLRRGIALGYVPRPLSAIGTQLAISIRGEAVPARVVETPFYRK
ncbi:MAG: glycine cleavage system aminomethyltransferase GcvT [Methanomassiliicoccales archaeon]|nr:glycine cleavage system aminomethyltransferase GcvT [Methanomassiliicoccales archaeon]